MQALQKTKASVVWEYFLKICSIPHPSKHEQQLVDWIISWADENSINCKQDEIGNLILKKSASVGYENKTPVILQAHLDMVPQKNNNIEHDFNKDPIKTIIDNGWLTADNTTLGADNGIGMAACLAVLADNNIEHGPLEVLLTTDEETGMTGAFGLEAGSLEGKILINTDSEDEGELYIGCAGGIDLTSNLEIDLIPVALEHVSYKILIDGLKGGHSGAEINIGRANAVKLLAGVLKEMESLPFQLSSMEGGTLRNAIPREAFAIVTVPKNHSDSLVSMLTKLEAKLVEEFKETDGGLKLTATPTDLPHSVLTSESQSNLINCIDKYENGVCSMDPNFEGVVQTSCSFGVLKQRTSQNPGYDIQVLIRSQIEEEKQELAQKLVAHFNSYGFISKLDGNYPGWKPNKDSDIYKIMETEYEKLFGFIPKTMVIHAGLECGLFSEHYPDWDMISVGPTISFPHSPDEKVDIATVDKFWLLLLASLKAID